MEMNRILVVFKTHLDIGFTDLAEAVTEKYMNTFLPYAMKVADELRCSGTDARLKWTTGSWLVHEYLERNKGTDKEQALVNAIENGDICWHALPCTTHTEIMDRKLFEYGLSLGKSLDSRFGKETHAAKMTDVPGHTKAMIPMLKKAGIDFLHIGVNDASTVPEVPEIFRWQCDSGEAINVIYNGGYGQYTPLGDTGVALVFAHTNDNLGCQSAQEIITLFEDLHRQFPGAEICAATLDDAADVVRRIEDTLPIITQEIGDSWIHGAGTDPTKTRMFRALEDCVEFMSDEDRKTLYKGLLMIPEHTWGCDEKTWLKDNVNYIRSDFEKLRNEPNYQKMEASWKEQRAFLTDAISKLSPEGRITAEEALAAKEPFETDISAKSEINEGAEITLGDYTFRFNSHGECTLLTYNDRIIADIDHRLFTVMYEKFCFDDYKRFYSQYNRLDVEWAREDFTKIGMESASTEHKRYYPEAKIYADSSSITVVYTYSGEEHTLYGAPGRLTLDIALTGKGLGATLQWSDKPASRVAEGMWIGFNPVASGKRISKLGTLIDPLDVISKGGRKLHGTDRGVYWNELNILSREALLVAPGKPSLLNFDNELPSADEGINFNLHNNKWGTNFPMWFSDDARFDFYINLEEI